METYKSIISEISIFLKTKGFKKKSHTFYKVKDSNFLLIHFQKSRSKNENGFSSFTINLGICSSLLFQFFGPKPGIPDIYDCHWNERIGFLLPARQDYWWVLDDSINVRELVGVIWSIIESKVIPILEKFSSDEALQEFWLSGSAQGITEGQRFEYLTMFLKKSNNALLATVANEYLDYAKKKKSPITAIEHLKELGIYHE
jgi:Domain of unknown function (DUF4304)